MISASELLNDTKAMNDLAKINGGLENRYDKFWEKVVDSTIDKLNLIDSEGFSRVELDSILKADLKNKGLTFGGDIYDRKSSTEFVMISIDDGVGLQEGHLIPTEELFYGNCVVQPPKDNVYNDNHPIRDIDAYIKQYLDDVKRIMGDDLDFIIFETTKLYLHSWKDQKNYKII